MASVRAPELLSVRMPAPSMHSGATSGYSDSRPSSADVLDFAKPLGASNEHGGGDDANNNSCSTMLDAMRDKDFHQKLTALRNSLSDEMKQLIVEHNKRSGSAPSAIEREAALHGVDFNVLRDLKVAFEMKKCRRGKDVHGVDEDEFLELFGPKLCEGMNEEETRHWFRCIDQNCSGSVQWQEVANYLSEYHQQARNTKDYFDTTTMEPPGTLGTRKHHKQPISRLVYSAALDTFYTGSSDGVVQFWDPRTLVAQPLHTSPTWIYDLVFLPHNNRLLVLQSDRSIFLYDCFLRENVLSHELYRIFATKGRTTRTFSDGNSFYLPVDKKTLLGDKRTVDRSALSDRLRPGMMAATLMETSSDGIKCIDHLGGSLSSGEPIICGTESGAIEVVNLLVGGSRPIRAQSRTQVHKGAVTQIHFASEINSVISCSVDCAVVVLDVEKLVVLARLTVQDQRKPLYGFEYKAYHNSLFTWAGRSLNVWNALTGAKITTLLDHDSPIVGVSLNVEKMHVYALLESKSVRVWDLRTWKSVGDFVDFAPRYPSDTLSFVYWAPEHHMLLTGCAEMFGIRPREVQERIEAGLAPSSASQAGHIHPIRDVQVLESASHVLSIDLHTCVVWGVARKRMLSSWKWPSADDHLNCFALAPDGVRILVGTEHGRVAWYNYACGYCMYRLEHSEGLAAVSCVAIAEGIAPQAPPLAIAAIGGALLSWESDRCGYKDVKTLAACYRHSQPDAVAWFVCVLDEKRQLLACSFSNADVKLLSFGLMPIAHYTAALPMDRIRPVIPGIFVGSHNDGSVRFYGTEPASHDVHLLWYFQASLKEEEPVTCLTVSGSRLIVGDALGCISVFDCGRLLNADYLRSEVIPNLGETFLQSTLRESSDCVRLTHAFDAHDGAITSVGVCNGEIFSSGGDRLLRCWSAEDFSLQHELGAVDKKAPGFYSFDTTREHEFSKKGVVVGGGKARRMTKALSFTRRGSVLATELREKRKVRLARQQAAAAAAAAAAKAREEAISMGVDADADDDDAAFRDDEANEDENNDDDDDAASQTAEDRVRFSSMFYGNARPRQKPSLSMRLAPLNATAELTAAQAFCAQSNVFPGAMEQSIMPVESASPRPQQKRVPLKYALLAPMTTLAMSLGLEPLPGHDAHNNPHRKKGPTLLLQPIKSPTTALSPDLSSSAASPEIGSPVSTDTRVTFPNSSGQQQQQHRAHAKVRRKGAPTEIELFKIATDRVVKLRTNLVRNIPDEAMTQKLQEVLRIREERLDSSNNAPSVFFRLPMQSMSFFAQQAGRSKKSKRSPLRQGRDSPRGDGDDASVSSIQNILSDMEASVAQQQQL